jgi:CheY-like chemotaxis protein
LKTRNTTLLVVEDDADQRLFIQKAFQSLETTYQVHAVSSGNEAIAYLKGEGEFRDRTKFQFPAYIITDLGMPNGDGFEILDFLKKNPALSVIPVVMLSSSDDPDDIRHAYLLGASSYLAKPPGQEALRALLKKIHEYWAECQVPEIDDQGYALETDSHGKRGERFPKPKKPRSSKVS